jgi:hypothetical protein
MNSDDKGKGAKETITDEVKALAGKIYDDAAAPSVKAAGSTLGRVVRLALRPLELIVEGGERLMSRVERKLAGVPEDHLLPPPATIAAPAALHYALLGDGDEVADLREMFENLLVTSMDRDTVASAHPAFVTMISQLAPDEAWILKSIDLNRTDYALITAQMSGKTTSGKATNEALGFRTRVGIGTGIDEARQLQYISNLERLGILRISDDPIANIEGFREYGLLHAAIKAEFSGRHPKILNGSIQVTPLGRQFLITCVCARTR